MIAAASPPIPVSVIVMTRNEEANLDACLRSLRRFAEVVVVDSASEDETVGIARSHGVRVEPFIWDKGYPKKKQWCLDRLPLTHDWVLFVDADEQVTPALADEIARLFKTEPAASAFEVSSRPVVLGRVLRFGGPYRKLALLHRRRCRYPQIRDLDVGTMWEVEGHYQPTVSGPIGRIRAPLLHHDRKSLFAWFARHNRYSDWEAAMDEERRRSPILHAETPGRRLAKRLFLRLPGRPLWVFLATYVLYLGILDGRAGLHHALARAFYYWQVAYKRASLRAAPEPSRDPAGAYSSSSASDASPARALISSKARRRTFSSGMR